MGLKCICLRALLHCGRNGLNKKLFFYFYKKWLIYLMQRDKDNVYPVFVSDSLASCNLYSRTNICIHTQTTCKLCKWVCVCAQHSLAGYTSCCLSPTPALLTQTRHLSQDRLEVLVSCSALPCVRAGTVFSQDILRVSRPIHCDT